MVVRPKARDSWFARRVRTKSLGQCAACIVDIDYEALRVLEAAHIQSVEADGPDNVNNALPLCPTHHRLFDEGLWSIGADDCIILSEKCRGSQGDV